MVRVYQVGGSVRDSLLGLKSKDIDYAVEASSYEEMREYILSQGKIYLETPQYFTIRAHMPDLGDADFVLCRKDGAYSDARRPDTVEVGTIFDDLRRRDFTVNAIALDMKNKDFLDPHGGQADLQLRILKCVGHPKDRFREDALRMLRAIRFAVTKNFTLSDGIKEALHDPELLSLLRDKISNERKKDELHRMLKHNTLHSLMLLHAFSGLSRALFNNSDIWLEPTLKSR